MNEEFYNMTQEEKFKVLCDSKLSIQYGIDSNTATKLIMEMEPDFQLQFILNPENIKMYCLKEEGVAEIVSAMPEEYVEKFVDNEKYISQLFGSSTYFIQCIRIKILCDKERSMQWGIDSNMARELIMEMPPHLQIKFISDTDNISRYNFEIQDLINIVSAMPTEYKEQLIQNGFLTDLSPQDKYNFIYKIGTYNMFKADERNEELKRLFAVLTDEERLNLIHNPEMLSGIEGLDKSERILLPLVLDTLSPEIKKETSKTFSYDLEYMKENGSVEWFKVLDSDLICNLIKDTKYIEEITQKLNISPKKLVNLLANKIDTKSRAVELLNDSSVLEKLEFKKSDIVSLVEMFPSKVIMEILKEEETLLKKLGIDLYNIANITRKMSSEDREELFRDEEYFKKISKVPEDVQEMFNKLSDEEKIRLINDPFALKKLRVNLYQIANLISDLNEDMQLAILNCVNVSEILREEKSALKVLKTIPAAVYCVSHCMYDNEAIKKLEELPSEDIMKVMSYNKEKNIENIQLFGHNVQKVLATRVEDLALDENSKVAMLLKLSKKVKDELTQESYQYSNILQLNYDENGINILDLTGDIEQKYRGLDKYLYVNPRNFGEEDKAKFDELCQICPNMKIVGGWKTKEYKRRWVSTVQEYKDGEEWINSALEGINPNWTDIQKVAYIDHAVGTRISYAPEFESEIFNWEDNATIWKTASRTYGICSGVAALEAYMLERAGIEVEEITSEPDEKRDNMNHAFLKINIRIKMPDGSEKKVSTLIDPTWNMTEHMYGLKPEYFCLSYNEIIAKDPTKFHVCNKFKEEEYATVGLDENSLREAFSNVGVADEDGNFPAKKHLDKLKEVMQTDISDEEKMSQVFNTVATLNPKFAETQDSTIDFLRKVMCNNRENMQYNKFVTDRVYDKEDESKTPVMYVYMDYVDGKKSVYVAVHGKEEFEEMSVEEFEQKYVCYDKDLEKNEGKRPWEELKTEDKDIEEP